MAKIDLDCLNIKELAALRECSDEARPDRRRGRGGLGCFRQSSIELAIGEAVL
jgi:hypothetical protein